MGHKIRDRFILCNLMPEECRAKINSKSSGCEANVLPTTPEKIGNTQQAKSLGKVILNVSHHTGKTEEEAIQHCK